MFLEENILVNPPFKLWLFKLTFNTVFSEKQTALLQAFKFI